GPRGPAAWGGPGPAGAGPAATVAVSAPVDRAAGVPTSTELALTGPDAASASVTLTGASGAAVPGAMRPDGTAWLPATQLRFEMAYTATVTAPGKRASRWTFATMARPRNLVGVSARVADGQVCGVALPIAGHFAADVARDQRASG